MYLGQFALYLLPHELRPFALIQKVPEQSAEGNIEPGDTGVTEGVRRRAVYWATPVLVLVLRHEGAHVVDVLNQDWWLGLRDRGRGALPASCLCDGGCGGGLRHRLMQLQRGMSCVLGG